MRNALTQKQKQLLRGIRNSTTVLVNKVQSYTAISSYLNDSERRDILEYYQILYEQEPEGHQKMIYEAFCEFLQVRNKEAQKLSQREHIRDRNKKMDEEIKQLLQEKKHLQEAQAPIAQPKGFFGFLKDSFKNVMQNVSLRKKPEETRQDYMQIKGEEI